MPLDIRDALAQLEVSARELDPGRTELDALWAAVEAHVLENTSSLGNAPAYAPESASSLDSTSYAVTESRSGIADALATVAAIESAGINQTSGGHFAFIPGGGLFPSALGDLLADVGNRYVGIRYAAPAAVDLERSLVQWMRALIGYPATAGGDLTSGASTATLEGIVTARDAFGIRSADVARSVVYLTDRTHHCVEKALRIAGLAECIVRRIKLDDRMRMRPDTLDAQIREDVAAGLSPWLVIATAGTIDTGAVDPLTPIADVVDANDLWLHVDAAYGGFFTLTDHGQRVLDGIGRSQAVVMDPHKGLFLPFGSGALIVRDERQLADAHRYSASYLEDARESGGVFSPSDLSLELSRPFRGLRLWLPLKLFGLAPFRAALEEKLLLARYFHARLSETSGWTVGPQPDLSVVTYRYLPRRGDANDFNRRLLEAVCADGRAVISSTEIDGAYTLRLAVLHYRTHLEDVETLLEVLTFEAARLAAA